MSDKGRVYFISDGDHVKIGWTNLKLSTRLCSLQCGNVKLLRFLGSISGTRDLERRLHETFHEYHVRGEWFKIEERLARLCARVQQEEVNEPNDIIADRRSKNREILPNMSKDVKTPNRQ
jgi:Meiotically up-regulated gene 113